MATLKYVGKEELNSLIKTIDGRIAYLERIKESTDISKERSYAYTVGKLHAYQAMKQNLKKFIEKEIG